MEALKQLAARPPREQGGAVASAGFRYQRNWIIQKLIELCRSGDDYVVLCEWHDDVVVITRRGATEHTRFYQIKTASVPWSLTKLCASKKKSATATDKEGSGLSILAKMLKNLDAMPTGNADAWLVSNQGYKFGKSVVEQAVDLLTLDGNLRTKILDAVAGQLKRPVDTGALKFLWVQKSSLASSNADEATMGVMAVFLQGSPGTARLGVKSLFDTLHSEIDMRSSLTLKGATCEDLRQKKSIDSAQFAQMLAAARPLEGATDAFKSFQAHLVASGFSPAALRDLEIACRDVELFNYSDPAGGELQELVDTATALIQEVGWPGSNMATWLDTCADRLSAKGRPNLNRHRVLAMLLAKFYEEGQS